MLKLDSEIDMDTSLKQQLRDAGYKGKFDLESLIDECGDRFYYLTKVFIFKDVSWRAVDTEGDKEDGKTPLIAVAKLYIKLHGRNT